MIVIRVVNSGYRLSYLPSAVRRCLWLANAVPCELGARIVLPGIGGNTILIDNEKVTSRDQWPSCSLSVPPRIGCSVTLPGIGGDAMLDDNEKTTSRDQWPSCSLSVPRESGAPSRCRELGAILY